MHLSWSASRRNPLPSHSIVRRHSSVDWRCGVIGGGGSCYRSSRRSARGNLEPLVRQWPNALPGHGEGSNLCGMKRNARRIRSDGEEPTAIAATLDVTLASAIRDGDRVITDFR